MTTGKKSLRMIQFFRSVKNDIDANDGPRGEIFLIDSICAILEEYEASASTQTMENFRNSLKELRLESHVTQIYGDLRPNLKLFFLEIDLHNLEEKLKAKGAAKREIEMARIVGMFLLVGRFPDMAWLWMSRSVWPRRECERFADGSLDFKMGAYGVELHRTLELPKARGKTLVSPHQGTMVGTSLPNFDFVQLIPSHHGHRHRHHEQPNQHHHNTINTTHNSNHHDHSTTHDHSSHHGHFDFSHSVHF